MPKGVRKPKRDEEEKKTKDKDKGGKEEEGQKK